MWFRNVPVVVSVALRPFFFPFLFCLIFLALAGWAVAAAGAETGALLLSMASVSGSLAANDGASFAAATVLLL